MREDDRKVLLVGGTSHVGKSTVAERIAAELGWRCLSTDQLARHPGRPWRNDGSRAPAEVVEHYGTLTTQGLVDDVLRHYRRIVGPVVDAIVQACVQNPFDSGLVFEGSAILPELAAARGDRVAAVWLTAPERTVGARIRRESGYGGRPAAERQLIDAFLERSLAFDRVIRRAAAAAGHPVLDVSAGDLEAELLRRVHVR